jgi:glycosyltransferase involved in cell wall biosynthesis
MSLKILFLVPYPENESPSQRFRFEQYLSLLGKENIQYKVQAFANSKNWKIFYSRGKVFKKIAFILQGLFKRTAILLEVPQYDFIFIHREVAPIGPPLFEWIIGVMLKKKIVYDFDDAIWLTERPDESLFKQSVKWRIKVKSICRWSARISCGNLYLCDYAYRYNHNIFLNPTTVDTDKVHNPALHPRKKSKEIIIGWTGSHSTLPYLDLIKDVLREVEATYPQVRIMVIADREPALGLRNMIFRPWSRENEISDLAEIDIGIMPLPDDKWAQGKCGFKALQYMAMEIPAVASPVGVNTSIIDHNVNGYLASSREEWLQCIGLLIADEGRRIAMGKLGREKVLQNYSVRSNASNFLSLFT